MLLSQSGYIPDTDRLVERGRDDEILLRMELCAHSVVIVAGHSTYLEALGGVIRVLRVDLLNEPELVSLHYCGGTCGTYGFASSICE